MTNLVRKYSRRLIICLMSLPLIAAAQQPLPVFKKQVTKSYKVTKTDRLSIDNQYGNVEIKTWAKSEVLIKISISTRAKSLVEAKLANRVHIVSQKDNSEIFCRTIIDTNQTGALKNLPWVTGNISYLVYVPQGFTLDIKNQFGNMNIGDYTGVLNVKEKFGDLNTGELSAPGKLNVEQGSVNIAHLHGGELIVHGFNHVTIAKASGMISAGLSSGELLDLKLTSALEGLQIKSDNIRQVNLGGVTNVDAFYQMHVILSKFNNLSALKFNEINPPSRQAKIKRLDSLVADAKRRDSISGGTNKDKVLSAKKLEDIKMIKKSKIYESGDKDAKCKVSIVVAFSVLNINN